MIFYTDGSASPNPGPGGWGVVGVENNEPAFVMGQRYEDKVTNNEMELKAILYIMLKYGVQKSSGQDVPIVYSDSSYCVNTLNDWMFSWASRGWIKADKNPPENLELIKAYYRYYQRGYRIDLKKVKGHAKILGNEIADKIAGGQIQTLPEAKIAWQKMEG